MAAKPTTTETEKTIMKVEDTLKTCKIHPWRSFAVGQPGSWAPPASLWAPKTEKAKMEAENTRLRDALKTRTDERDTAVLQAGIAHEWLKIETHKTDEAVARADAAEQERDKARAACVWFERRIVALMAELARRPALVELDKKSGHNPFREIRVDRRLMGPGV